VEIAADAELRHCTSLARKISLDPPMIVWMVLDEVDIGAEFAER
jgi:hypothetical protein